MQCEVTGRRDHGRIEPRWFSIHHTESIHSSNRFKSIIHSSNILLVLDLSLHTVELALLCEYVCVCVHVCRRSRRCVQPSTSVGITTPRLVSRLSALKRDCWPCSPLHRPLPSNNHHHYHNVSLAVVDWYIGLSVIFVLIYFLVLVLVFQLFYSFSFVLVLQYFSF